MEEQNPGFFKAYQLRLLVKNQIQSFNYLVSQQAQIMQKRAPAHSAWSGSDHQQIAKPYNGKGAQFPTSKPVDTPKMNGRPGDNKFGQSFENNEQMLSASPSQFLNLESNGPPANAKGMYMGMQY
mmetsp:Transcript_5342/g.5824  ORF Transcript_5342/g.5824 Transcript_5342/m.5824 type:complete len:125 (-) Transcript_5342:134-508(-)